MAKAEASLADSIFQNSQRPESKQSEQHNQIHSPDDGLPDKQIWMFDGSQFLDQTTTNLQQNSLYYLEH